MRVSLIPQYSKYFGINPFVCRDSAPPGVAQESYDARDTRTVIFHIGHMYQGYQYVTVRTETRVGLSRIGSEMTLFGFEVSYHLVWLGSFTRQSERQECLGSIVGISKY